MRKLLRAAIINNKSGELKNYLYLTDNSVITEIEKRFLSKENTKRKNYKNL